MNKLEVTQKEMKEKCFKNELISIPYCNLQTLLRFEQPFAFSEGIYDWTCDYYKLNNFIIATSYVPCGQNVPNSIIKKYEKKAENIHFDVKNQKGIYKIYSKNGDFFYYDRNREEIR